MLQLLLELELGYYWYCCQVCNYCHYPNTTPAKSTTPQAWVKPTTKKPTTKNSSKSNQAKPATKPAATSQPSPASVPSPTLKAPVSWLNKIYNLQFPLTAWGDLAAMAVQHLCLSEFFTTICCVDETAVLLPYKTFYALMKKFCTSWTSLVNPSPPSASTFQGFCSQHLTDTMYISVLVAYNSPQEDFFKSLHPEMENLSHKIYTCSIKAPFISKIGWLFHLHKHTDPQHLIEILEGILHWLNPNGPIIALGFQFKNIWDGIKMLKASLPSASGPSTNATASAQPKHQIVKAVHVELPRNMRVFPSTSSTKPFKVLHLGTQQTL